MANRKPIVLVAGKEQQLQDADSLLANTVVISEPTNAPMTITSTTVVTNLNADMVDGFHASQFNGIRTMLNDNAGSLVIGQPVYVKSNGAVDKARANALSTCNTLGLVRDTSISAAASGAIQFIGILTATTTQWDAITLESGGLTPGAYYYVSTSAGLLSQTAPSTVGEVVKEALFAISSTEALIVHTYAILL
jgi:hypothetical protein